MALFLNNLLPIHTFRLRVNTHHTIHHKASALAELIDSTDGINGAVQGAARIEVLLNGRQEVLAGAALDRVIGRVDPDMLQGFVGGHALLRIDCETAVDEVAGLLRDTAPVFEGCEGVVGGEDGLHFFQVGVAVERGVPA